MFECCSGVVACKHQVRVLTLWPARIGTGVPTSALLVSCSVLLCGNVFQDTLVPGPTIRNSLGHFGPDGYIAGAGRQPAASSNTSCPTLTRERLSRIGAAGTQPQNADRDLQRLLRTEQTQREVELVPGLPVACCPRAAVPGALERAETSWPRFAPRNSTTLC